MEGLNHSFLVMDYKKVNLYLILQLSLHCFCELIDKMFLPGRPGNPLVVCALHRRAGKLFFFSDEGILLPQVCHVCFRFRFMIMPSLFVSVPSIHDSEIYEACKQKTSTANSSLSLAKNSDKINPSASTSNDIKSSLGIWNRHASHRLFCPGIYRNIVKQAFIVFLLLVAVQPYR